jgi:hypothetical protein
MENASEFGNPAARLMKKTEAIDTMAYSFSRKSKVERARNVGIAHTLSVFGV